MTRDALGFALLALGGIGAVCAVTFIIFAAVALSPGSDDQISVTSRDGPLRVGPATLEIELLDWAGEPIWLEEVRVRSDALRIDGSVRRDENGSGIHTVPVTALRAGPTTLMIEQWWNEHSRRMTTSVPIVVLPAQ